MARSFLIVWLAAFAIQSTAVLTFMAADVCTEDVQGAAADPCPEGCPRCLCCARVPAHVVSATPVIVEDVVRSGMFPPLTPSTSPSPHGVYHVPKHS